MPPVKPNLHHSIVTRASTQRSRTRIQNAQGLRVSRRVGTDMEVARRGAVGHLGVLLLPVEVRVVVDKVVPAHGLVLGGLQLEGRDLLNSGVALVIARVEHQDLEARDSQSGCERTATRAGPHDYVVVVGGLGRTPMGIVSMVVVPIASVSAPFCSRAIQGSICTYEASTPDSTDKVDHSPNAPEIRMATAQ